MEVRDLKLILSMPWYAIERYVNIPLQVSINS